MPNVHFEDECCPKRIAILGAGASGLTAIKACREEGLDVVCYERTTNVGGLWRYTDDSEEGLASVMKSTIINSSKELSAFSDFPPPPEFPNYMHNSKMIRYLEMYATHYGMVPFVKFRHQVLKITPAEDYRATRRWIVSGKDLSSDQEFSETFDGVMVCTGHHVYPIETKFYGQEKFQGNIKHTHNYKKPDGYQDKTVLVVGVGNSGGDAAVELSSVAKQVYLSTRRGAWIIHRVGRRGRPFDLCYMTRFCNFFFNLIPYSIVCYFCEREINQRFDHDMYHIKPKHHIFGQHPMVNDALPNRILSGTIQVKGDITHFTEDGVVFEGESKPVPVDEVVLATGYKVHFPFIDERLVPQQDNRIDVYKLVFHPNHPTLAFIGLAQPIGPLMPISELQSRWVARVFAAKCELPSRREMWAHIHAYQDRIRDRYFEGPRNTLQLDWIDYMDSMADLIGAKPNIPRLLFRDPKLAYMLVVGPCMPYNYRIEGPHPWKNARKAILEYEHRVKAPLTTRHIRESKECTSLSIVNFFRYIVGAIFSVLFVLIFAMFSF